MHRTKKSLSKPKPPRNKDYNTLPISLYPTTRPYPNPLDRYPTVTTYHSHSPPIGTYVTCSQKPRLNHPLTPPPHTTRNVIYQIPCKDCNAIYCGQTRRPLHLRLSEHQRFTNNFKSFTSTDLQYTLAVAHHAHTTGPTIDFKSTHILSSLTKSSQLDLTEHAAIKIICPSLSTQH